jgi:hypothetical protein
MWPVRACANSESNFLRSSMDSTIESRLLTPGGLIVCTSLLLEGVFFTRASPVHSDLIPTSWLPPSSVRFLRAGCINPRLPSGKHPSGATAVSELLYAEAIGRSGPFLQERATLYDSGNGYINSETPLSATPGAQLCRSMISPPMTKGSLRANIDRWKQLSTFRWARSPLGRN